MTKERLRELYTHYATMADNPVALFEEARRLMLRPGLQHDPELCLYLGLLIGQVARLADRVDELEAKQMPPGYRPS